MTFASDKSQSAIQSVPGDYQYKATYEGRISQRRWHLQKHALLKHYLEGKDYINICDAGCGSGVLAASIASWNAECRVTAYDINESSLNFAQKQYQGIPNVKFMVRDLLKGDNSGDNGDCDFICSMEVIEHFSESDVSSYLSNLRNLGKPGARYLISTPDYGSLWPVIEWSLDLLSLTPRMADHQHLCKFTKESLVETLSAHGFKVIDIFNFCGISPFLGHISGKLADLCDNFESRHKLGNLICCEFEKMTEALI